MINKFPSRYCKWGQTTLEYLLVVTIVLGAFVATTLYLKRGIQGKWKETIDQVGEQYDPTLTVSNILYNVTSNSASLVQITIGTVSGQNGVWTNRVDTATTTETKTGSSATGSPP